MDDLIKTDVNRKCQGRPNRGSSSFRSSTVVSDGFTHRRWPWSPRFWGSAQLFPM